LSPANGAADVRGPEKRLGSFFAGAFKVIAPASSGKETVMKTSFLAMCLLGLGMLLVNFGCSTETPGTKDTLGSYSTMIDSSPDKVTTAAQKAAADLNLLDINAAGTKVDGKVSARTAQGDDVSIDIEQAGENVSKVTIRVGVTGDEAVSKQLMDRIKSHLSWL
jgi:hypothetical protein